MKKTSVLRGSSEGRADYLVSKFSGLSWLRELWSTNRPFPFGLKLSKWEPPKWREKELKHSYVYSHIYFSIQTTVSQIILGITGSPHVTQKHRKACFVGVWVKLPQLIYQEERKTIFIQLSTAEHITLLFLGDRVHYRMNKAMISADLSSITSSTIYCPLTMSKSSNLSKSQ